MRLGFIGLGKMGQPMAERLVSAGHDVGVYNRTPSKCDHLVSLGAKRMQTALEAARYGSVLITMLENDSALSSMAAGHAGFCGSLRRDAIHIAMGTHGIHLIEKLASDHAAAGQRLVSAPVLGRPPAAEAGQLGIIVGGQPEAVDFCRPLFAAMGRRTFEAGPNPVAATIAKIVNNFILACSIESMGEGFALGRKFGLPPAALLDVLTDGLFSGPAHRIYGRLIAEGNYGEGGFTATTGLKDVELALAAGENASVPLPSADVCRHRLKSAISNGFGASDWSVMAQEQARASGIA